MKMLKLLRMIRLLRTFRELRLILSSIMGCVKSMMWTGVLVLAVSYMFGIALLQASTDYLRTNEGAPPNVRSRIYYYWGSVMKAMGSLYMSSLGGEDWIRIVEPLAHVGGFFYCLFVLYIAIFAFVIMN